jgi:hypothetical protein
MKLARAINVAKRRKLPFTISRMSKGRAIPAVMRRCLMTFLA